jgi:Tfp pilus assembly protein PilX
MIRHRQEGIAYVLALILLAMFASMAVAFVAAGDMNAGISRNTVSARLAQHATESGLAFALRQFKLNLLPASTTSANLIANLSSALAGQLNGTSNLAGASVTCDGTSIHVPPISLGSESFEIAVAPHADGNYYIEVTGHAGAVSRTVSMQLYLTTPSNSAFDYGLASRGSISISGNGEIRGQNNLTEASVISTTTNPVAISVGGSAVIDGDLSCVTSNTAIVISGNPTVAGTQNIDQIAQHVHFGVEAPVFPEVDTSIFRSLATGMVIDKNTDTSQKDAVYSNVLIKANTNPTFSSDVTLNGVVYVEAPNIVTFTSKVTINGLVATDQTNMPLGQCKLSFAGQVEAMGVEALPDDPQYTQVKQLTGTFIAAQGFDVSFAGQFTTINGTIAASKLTFSGQAAGTVKGSVIGLANNDSSVSGTVDIIIDRSNCPGIPPGFRMPVRLAAVPSSYTESDGI